VIWRRRLVALAVLATGLIAGYTLWLRDSPLVAVESVNVVGASGPDAVQIRTALDAAGRDMTTLHIREDSLRDAVDAFPTVRTVTADASFPSGLTVTVIQRRPVATVRVAGRGMVAAEDGVLLPGVRAPDGAPKIELAEQGHGRALTGEAREAAIALGAAPAPLRRHLQHADAGEDGIVVSLRDGPELIFGTAARAAAKWAAAARLLVEPGLEGAAYIDLRTPDRPAVGGLQPSVQAQEAP
jgi:cell division protein FtsQ